MIVIILATIRIPTISTISKLSEKEGQIGLTGEEFTYLLNAASKVLSNTLAQTKERSYLNRVALIIDPFCNVFSQTVNVLTLNSLHYKPILATAISGTIISNLFLMSYFRHFSIIPLSLGVDNRFSMIFISTVNFLLVTSLSTGLGQFALLTINQASGNIPFDYFQKRLSNHYTSNRAYFLQFALQYVGKYNPLIFFHLKSSGKLHGHLSDYFNPNFFAHFTFENEMDHPVLDHRIDDLELHPEYKFGCLLATTSCKRIILYILIHFAPLPVSTKNILHSVIFVSNLRKDIVKEKILKFKSRLFSIYNKEV